MIGRNKDRREVRVDSGVGVDDEFEREAVDAREALKFTAFENGKGFIEAPWKVLFNCGDVTLNDVVVIKHPFRARCERFSVVSRFSKALVYPFENLSIVFIGGEESSGAPPTEGASMRLGELDSEFSERLPTKDLCSPR